VYEGTTTNSYVPAYVFYFDDFTKSQFVIPAADLEEMTNATITGIKFYTNSDNIPYTSVSDVVMYLMEVDYTSINAYEPRANGTLVYQGVLGFVSEGDGGSLTIEFSTPYTYTGGNLLVGIENITDIGWKNVKFFGTTVNGASIAGYNSLSLDGAPATQRNFIPKTTFTYIPTGSVVCERPATFVVNDVTAHTALLTWSGGDSIYNVEYKKAEDESWYVYANGISDTTLSMINLLQFTDYQVRIQSLCEEGVSGWRYLSFSTVANYNRIYVTENGTGDGGSWATATSDLNWALTTASMIKNVYGTAPDVWVAAGIYYGDTTATNAFTMREGVNVYGGFAGYEPADYDLSLRNFDANATILDGQNARRVLYQSSSFSDTTIWEGFTVKNGHTLGDGGGVYIRNKVVIRGCHISNNFAFLGGGLYVNANAKIENCELSHNTASGTGGAVWVGFGTTITNCLICNNETNNGNGGGVLAYGSVVIRNSTIVRNTSYYDGSGVYGSTSATLENSIVWGNKGSNNVSGGIKGYYCAVEGGCPGNNNILLSDEIQQTPMFVNPSHSAEANDTTANVDYHLQNGSVCVNRGSNFATVTVFDLDGAERVKKDTVDIGCYESEYYSVPVINPTYSGIIYVSQYGSGTKTGEDWNNATSSINFANVMANMHNVSQVWVSTGKYYGDTTANNAFTMWDSVNVYGGFAGNEPADYDLSLRNFEENETILDGDSTRSVLRQSYNFNNETVWDGFTIQNGYSTTAGGGVYLQSKGVLRRCIVRNNISEDYGGGVYANPYGASQPYSLISKCKITNNKAIGTSSYGGGVYAYYSVVDSCVIDNNTSYQARGIGVDNGSIISNCQISNNGYATVTVGSVKSSVSLSSSKMLNCYVFDNNGVKGVDASNSSVVTNCYIYNNGMGVGLSASFLSNCLIYNNIEGVKDSHNSVINNSTIVRNGNSYNDAGLSGNGTVLTNSIVWGNELKNGHLSNISGSVTCSYSAIEGGYSGDSIITLNAQNPPLFVNPSLTAGADDSTDNVDWHLQQGSPCINAGDNSVVTDSVDLDGNPRVKEGRVDMGCYEYDPDYVPVTNYDSIIYVTVTGAGTHSGNSWANATSSIDTAQTLAQANDAVVWVAVGTYFGDTTGTNAFTMVNGVHVYGGFAGNESADYDLSLRDFETNATILDGQNARRVLNQPMNFNSETIWDGFTIQHGRTLMSDSIIPYYMASDDDFHGGGVFLRRNGILVNCLITNNTACLSGGGIRGGMETQIINCRIVNNTALYGGGARVYASDVSNCIISNNTATKYGGGILYGLSTILNCTITHNTAVSGGGVFQDEYNSSIGIRNTLIANNTATSSGGGIYAMYGGGHVNNSTIVCNSSGIQSTTYTQMSNCIVWGNKTNGHLNNVSGSLTCSYSAIEDGYDGVGNIVLNNVNSPLFVNPSLTAGANDSTANVDWHLQQGSPCINAGDNSAVTDSLDLDGTARIKRDTVDLGCYESDYYRVPIIEYGNVIYVTVTGAGNHSGINWANATSSIEDAQVLAQMYNAVVWVAAGTYYGDVTASNAFTMRNGVNVYGGFAGNEPLDYDLSLRDFEANKTVLDGNLERRVLNQSDNFSVETTWDGFTLQNGKISGYGGGASIRRNGKLEQCVIKSNNATGGAGVYCTYAEISKCEICYNSSDGVGGGIYGSYSTIKHCNVVRNTGSQGGGLLADHTNVLGCIINHNVASAHGGGIYSYESNIENCLIANNSLHNYQYGGIGSGVFGSNCNMVNSTVVHNSSISNNTSTNGQTGVGVYGANIVNSVIWGNEHNGTPRNLYSVTCSYSTIEGGYSGDSIITLNAQNPPLFVNPSLTVGAGDSTANVDWHLQQGSPCINRGDNSAVTDSLDLDCTARIKRDTVDMGCYESDYYSVPMAVYDNIIYVTPTGAGDHSGNSWANATSSIDTAQTLALAHNAVVWVAAGTYFGDTLSDNAFTMHDGVSVYGGFAGNEPADYDLSLRDFEVNATILDGMNARRVLYQPLEFNNTTVWDGFTIQKGQTTGNGGGVYLQRNGALNQCVVTNNESINGYYSDGGGVYAILANVTNCMIVNNTAPCAGGIYAGSSVVSNCSILGNTATRMSTYVSSFGGGGVSAYSSTISNCLITNNHTEYFGGGVYARYSSVVTNCQITGNTSSVYGGGVYIDDGAIVRGCLISNNSSASSGGGVDGQGTVVNTTIVRNKSGENGAGANGGTLTNCIVWGNERNGVVDNLSSNLTCSYSAIENGYLGAGNTILNETILPLFVNPSLTAGADDSTANVDWHLLQGSPCVNRGDNSAVTDSLDMDGTARIKRDTVDLGCYESDYYSVPLIGYGNIVYVTVSGAGDHTGDSWENALSSIYDAQAIAQTYNAMVWVAAGVYYGDTLSDNAFTMVDAVNVYGGFAGDEPADYDMSLRDFEANATILDGQGVRRVLYQPYKFNSQTVWDGFTIQNGHTSGNGGGVYLRQLGALNQCVVSNNVITDYYSDGGGVYAVSANVTNCMIVNNTAPCAGGIYAGSSVVSDCSIIRNTATRMSTYVSSFGGGGVSAFSSTISNCLITNNHTEYFGGGVYARYSSVITNCQITANTSAVYGGGMYIDDGAIVRGCLISNNSSASSGGGLDGQGTVVNTTIVRNESGENGAGANGAALTNCIVWGNERNGVPDNLSSGVSCSYSAIEGGLLGEGNILLNNTMPPLFVNPSLTAGAEDATANVDWHLFSGSPCANKGNNAAVADSLDLDGTPRIKLDTVDMGCYETDNYSIMLPEVVTVNVVVDNNSLGTAMGSGYYYVGDMVTLQAVPNQYTRFVRWSDNDTTNPHTIIADRDTTLTAYFEIYLPELHVTSISHSDLIGGEYVAISWTVQNDGTAPTPNGEVWYDRVWLSVENRVAADDNSPILLGELPNVSALAPGEYYTQTDTVKIPLSVTGTYYLFVITDAYDAHHIYWDSVMRIPYNPPAYIGANSEHCLGNGCDNRAGNRILEISELDNYPYYHDNFFYELVDIAMPALPDLIVDFVLPDRQNFYSGTNVDIQFEVKNVGNYDTRVTDWYDVVFISNHEVFDETARLLAIIPRKNAIYVPDPIPGGSNPSDEVPKSAQKGIVFQGVLLPDSSYQVSTTVQVPLDIFGTSYFYVYTDYNNQVYEHVGQFNNVTRSDSVNIVLTPPADLVPENIIADNVVSTGALFNFSYEVHNKGAGAPNNSFWADGCYLSTSADSLENPIQIRLDWHHDGFLTGAFYEVQHSIPLPEDITVGSYYLFVKTDVGNAVFEYTLEDNNLVRYAQPITVVQPDLRITSLNVADTLHAGTEAGVSYLLVNTGDGAVVNRSVRDGFFLSHSPNGSEPIQLPQYTSNLWLNAHDSVVKYKNVLLPFDLQDGTYYLFAQTNVNHLLRETNTENNRSPIKQVFVNHCPLPDLVITDINLPDTLTAGDSVVMGIHLHNQGEVAANIGNLNWQLYSTRDGHQYNCFVGSGAADISMIAPGNSVYVQKTVFVAPTVFGNPAMLTLVVNPNHSVIESNYSNNSHIISRLVQPYPFDLATNQLSAPNETVSGEYIPVSWKVDNIGSVPTSTQTTYLRKDTLYLQSNGALLPKSWFDRVYLSTDTLVDANDEEIGSYARNLTLYADSSYTVNMDCQIPVLADGNYYILVVSDADGVTFDCRRINNVAAKSIAITQSTLPDLQIDSVKVPINLTTGMSYSIICSISNRGEHVTHGDRWTDAIYLNGQPTLDNAILIGSRIHNGQLEVDNQYSESIGVYIPYVWEGDVFLIVYTDATDQIVEMNSNANNLSILPVSVNRPLPCDLTVFPPNFPQSANVGEEIQISWALQNIGLNIAQGEIKDAVYLSTDSTWSSDDIMLGSETYSVNLAANDQEQRSLTLPLQGVPTGDYYVVVRTNILNALNENSYTNNKAVSLMTMHVDYPSLYIDQEEQVQLNSGQSVYYKLEVGPEYEHQTLSCKLTAPTPNVSNGLYIAYSSAPSASNFDWSATMPYVQEQEILIPSLNQGTYYIMATGQMANNAVQPVTLLATIVDFEIISVTANSGANTGSVTTQIIGAKFDTVMDFRLANSNGYLPAEKVFFHNSTESYATFNLRDQETGVYDMVAELPGGIITVKGQAFVVEPGLPAELLTHIVAPSSVRRGNTFTVTIEYGNNGSTDLNISGFLLVSTNGFPIAFSSDSLANNATELTFETGEPNGNPDVIRPGHFATKTIFVKATHVGNINLKLYPIRRQY